jgi:IS5 family transposase
MSTSYFFRPRLDAMIDLRHPLAVLATRLPWAQIEANLAPVFAHRNRAGKVVEGFDLFRPTQALTAVGVSPAGRPRLAIRLMVALLLLYLKHAYNLSDDCVIERWAQDVYFQFFSGQEYFQAQPPCDKAQLSRFRRALGEAGVEELLNHDRGFGHDGGRQED